MTEPWVMREVEMKWEMIPMLKSFSGPSQLQLCVLEVVLHSNRPPTPGMTQDDRITSIIYEVERAVPLTECLKYGLQGCNELRYTVHLCMHFLVHFHRKNLYDDLKALYGCDIIMLPNSPDLIYPQN